MKFPVSPNLRIMDDTLREGSQTPNVVYTAENRVKIFEKLVDVGIDLVNVGSPSVRADYDGIRGILALGYGDVEVVGHCGCSVNEVDAAADLGLDSLKLYIAPTEAHLKAKFQDKRFSGLAEMREFCIERIQESVDRADSRGIRTVSYTPEDITSVIGSADETNFAMRAIETALSKAHRIALPDTRGRAVPEEIGGIVRRVKDRFSNYNFEVEAHFHNDLGLAVANSLAAVKAGADIVHATVNGLGERVGITSLETLDAALYYGVGFDTGLKKDRMYELSRLVESMSGMPIARNAPVVGENAFSHTAGRHQGAIAKDSRTYQTLESDVYGRGSIMAFGTLTGRGGVEGFLSDCGVDVSKVGKDEIADIVGSIRGYTESSGFCDPIMAKGFAEARLGYTIELPQKYRDSVFSETYVLINTPTGENEITMGSQIVDSLSKMPHVIRIDEVFGRKDVNYIALLRYRAGEDSAVTATRRALSGIDGGISAEVIQTGNKYRM
ncbi:MAG: hypothetical protein HY833_01055 [Candidatus Aenigmarchaeota archaeon]|nr:hypothetical protein [Candidatus Aenigmarchaeota archaeon]